MKTKTAPHPANPVRQLIIDWLFTINLFYILFSLVALAIFLLGPGSGRLSTLVCKPDPWGKVVCTVKIYGVHKMYRKDFLADDYMYVLSSNNYGLNNYSRAALVDLSLPWSDALGASSSDEFVCAVSIRIQSQLVDFIPPYQKGSVCSLAEEQVKAAFAGDRSAINVRINGYNPQISWRIKLLIIASLLFLYQCAARLIWRRREKYTVVVLEGQAYPSAPGTADLRSDAELQPAEQGAHPVGLGRKRFILFWWATGVVATIFLVISSLLNSLVKTGFWLSGCFLNIHDYQKLYMQYPFTNLISLLPYIIPITLWMVLQWQVLRTEVPVSRWWIAAPVLAGIPLLIWMPPVLSCNDVAYLELPSIFPASNSQAATVLSVMSYFLIFGIIHWLVLRGKMKISIGWIVIPFLSVSAATVIPFIFFIFSLEFISMLQPGVILWIALISWALILLVLANSFNLVLGFYLHRAIHKKQTSPLQQVPV